MERREWIISTACTLALGLTGCRGRQVAHVLKGDDPDMVGSHAAGAETWEPLIATTVGELLGRQMSEIQPVSLDGAPCRKRVCFVSLENKSGEELGDFRSQIYEKIDTSINEAEMFELVNRRFVEAGLRACRKSPDDLFVPSHQRAFQAAMEKEGNPVDYLLWAVITSGTTRNNKSYQRDYLLTLELVNIHNGETDKESAELRKGYHKTRLGKLKNYGVG